jgi:hypothetical protein
LVGVGGCSLRLVELPFTAEFGGSCCGDQAPTSNGGQDGFAE